VVSHQCPSVEQTLKLRQIYLLSEYKKAQLRLSFLFTLSPLFYFDTMPYQKPHKRIITKEHLDDFLSSQAYDEYINYILRLNDAVKNIKISADVTVSKVSSST
jgi:hypothetical protein